MSGAAAAVRRTPWHLADCDVWHGNIHIFVSQPDFACQPPAQRFPTKQRGFHVWQVVVVCSSPLSHAPRTSDLSLAAGPMKQQGSRPTPEHWWLVSAAASASRPPFLPYMLLCSHHCSPHCSQVPARLYLEQQDGKPPAGHHPQRARRPAGAGARKAHGAGTDI